MINTPLFRRSLLAGVAPLAAAATLGAVRTAAAQAPALPAPTVGRPEPFRIALPQARLDWIRERVAAYPWPERPLLGPDGQPAGWRYGADMDFMRRLAEHWLARYDWRAAEARLNRFANFRVEIDGARLHYLHERASRPDALPLLIIHGWPYSALSYVDQVERLAHPERFGGRAEDGFHVVVASLPGSGFSDAPRSPEGLGANGRRYHALMTRVLGHPRYVVHGGDQGALSAGFMAVQRPEAVIGLSQHMLFPRQPEAGFGSGSVGAADATEAERAFAAAEQRMVQEQMAYFFTHVQRGETLAAAMADSPVGAAAWIVEKFYFWSDQRERSFERIFTMDRLLDEAMMYLAVPGGFRTALWPYMAFQHEPPMLAPGERIMVPTHVQQWADPLHPKRPREFVERSAANIVRWSDMPRGGHFPFYEEPDAWRDDVLAFGRQLRGG